MKKLILFCVILAFVFLFSGCHGESATKETVEPGTKQELRIVSLGSYYSLSCEADRYIKAFKAANPDINVTAVYNNNMEEDIWGAEILSAIHTGETPADIIIAESSGIYPLIRDGMIQDLQETPLLKTAMSHPKLLEGLENFCTVNGKRIGVPAQIYYEGFLVNQSLFEACGLTVPPLDWNYDDYYELAIASRQQDEKQSDTYLMYAERSIYNFFSLLPGIDVRDEIQARFDTPEFISYLQKAKSVLDSGALYHEEHDHTDSDSHDMEHAENLLLYPLSYVDFHDYQEGTIEDGAIILPIPQAVTPYLGLSGQLMCLSASAKNTDAAVAFIAGFLDEDYQRSNARELQLYQDLSGYTHMSAYPKAVETWIADMTRRGRLAVVPTELLASTGDLIVNLDSGKLTMEQFAAELQQEAAKQLSK